MAGAQAEFNGERLWDLQAAYPHSNSEYCRTACGSVRCPQCPQPKLLPDALPGITAFIAVSTQWRHGFGGRTGLDYTACIATWRLRLPRWRRESPAAFIGVRLGNIMDDVRVIEAALLKSDNERREAEEAERKRNAPQ